MKRLFLLILLFAVLLTACSPSPMSASTSTPALVPTKPLPTSTKAAALTESSPTTKKVADTPSPNSTVPVESSKTLTVYAAASLLDAFTQLGQEYEVGHVGIKVVFNFAGSQTLGAQLSQGAVADVFASANQTEMDKLVTAGLVKPAASVDFVTNRLEVILPSTNPAGIHSLKDLTHVGLKIVLADETVPVGKYARQVLDNLSQDPAYGPDFAAKVLANVVSNETDVKQVVAKVQLGEADAGIVYVSDSVAASGLPVIEIPTNFNVVARYPIAVLANAPQPSLGTSFIEYILSRQGQAILKNWGFTPVAP
jgi:molybdate transport system substrate-binding protein